MNRFKKQRKPAFLKVFERTDENEDRRLLGQDGRAGSFNAGSSNEYEPPPVGALGRMDDYSDSEDDVGGEGRGQDKQGNSSYSTVPEADSSADALQRADRGSSSRGLDAKGDEGRHEEQAISTAESTPTRSSRTTGGTASFQVDEDGDLGDNLPDGERRSGDGKPPSAAPEFPRRPDMFARSSSDRKINRLNMMKNGAGHNSEKSLQVSDLVSPHEVKSPGKAVLESAPDTLARHAAKMGQATPISAKRGPRQKSGLFSRMNRNKQHATILEDSDEPVKEMEAQVAKVSSDEFTKSFAQLTLGQASPAGHAAPVFDRTIEEDETTTAFDEDATLVDDLQRHNRSSGEDIDTSNDHDDADDISTRDTHDPDEQDGEHVQVAAEGLVGKIKRNEQTLSDSMGSGLGASDGDKPRHSSRRADTAPPPDPAKHRGRGLADMAQKSQRKLKKKLHEAAPRPEKRSGDLNDKKSQKKYSRSRVKGGHGTKQGYGAGTPRKASERQADDVRKHDRGTKKKDIATSKKVDPENDPFIGKIVDPDASLPVQEEVRKLLGIPLKGTRKQGQKESDSSAEKGAEEEKGGSMEIYLDGTESPQRPKKDSFVKTTPRGERLLLTRNAFSQRALMKSPATSIASNRPVIDGDKKPQSSKTLFKSARTTPHPGFKKSLSDRFRDETSDSPVSVSNQSAIREVESPQKTDQNLLDSLTKLGGSFSRDLDLDERSSHSKTRRDAKGKNRGKKPTRIGRPSNRKQAPPRSDERRSRSPRKKPGFSDHQQDNGNGPVDESAAAKESSGLHQHEPTEGLMKESHEYGAAAPIKNVIPLKTLSSSLSSSKILDERRYGNSMMDSSMAVLGGVRIEDLEPSESTMDPIVLAEKNDDQIRKIDTALDSSMAVLGGERLEELSDLHKKPTQLAAVLETGSLPSGSEEADQTELSKDDDSSGPHSPPVFNEFEDVNGAESHNLSAGRPSSKESEDVCATEPRSPSAERRMSESPSTPPPSPPGSGHRRQTLSSSRPTESQMRSPRGRVRPPRSPTRISGHVAPLVSPGPKTRRRRHPLSSSNTPGNNRGSAAIAGASTIQAHRAATNSNVSSGGRSPPPTPSQGRKRRVSGAPFAEDPDTQISKELVLALTGKQKEGLDDEHHDSSKSETDADQDDSIQLLEADVPVQVAAGVDGLHDVDKSAPEINPSSEHVLKDGKGSAEGSSDIYGTQPQSEAPFENDPGPEKRENDTHLPLKSAPLLVEGNPAPLTAKTEEGLARDLDADDSLKEPTQGEDASRIDGQVPAAAGISSTKEVNEYTPSSDSLVRLDSSTSDTGHAPDSNAVVRDDAGGLHDSHVFDRAANEDMVPVPPEEEVSHPVPSEGVCEFGAQDDAERLSRELAQSKHRLEKGRNEIEMIELEIVSLKERLIQLERRRQELAKAEARTG